MSQSINLYKCNLDSCAILTENLCRDCETVYYCGVEHQRADWKDHQKICKVASKALDSKHSSVVSTKRKITSNSSSSKKQKLTHTSSNLFSLPEELFGKIFSYLTIHEGRKFIYTNKEGANYHKNINFLKDFGARDLDLNENQALQWIPMSEKFFHVKNLHFERCGDITDADLKFLQALKNLQHLTLGFTNNPKDRNSQLTDVGMSYLTPHTNLQHLNLEGCDITNAGLAL